MSIIGIGGIYNRNQTLNVRQRPQSAINQIGFGKVLESTPAKDTFEVSPVFEAYSKRTAISISSDFPDTQEKLDDISEDIKNADYSGMTNAEIYVDIENKYARAFDNFYITMVYADCKDCIMISNRFWNDIKNNAGNVSQALINEARGYADMSYDDIENVIKEKYVGKTGVDDQLNLFGELFSTGVLFGKYGMKKTTQMAMDLKRCAEYGENTDILRNEWLSKAEELGYSSPFSLLINNPLFLKFKEKYQFLFDEILIDAVDKQVENIKRSGV